MIINRLHLFISIILSVSLLHHPTISLSQSDIRGVPFIENYSKEDYDGGTQNWDSEVMQNGHIFMANDNGILHFNGVAWQKYPLPNKTIARSLCITKNRIYVGGQDELGFLAPTLNGQLVFHSIREYIPEKFLPLQDVWQLVEYEEKIYARSVNRIYIFDPSNDSFEVKDPHKDPPSLIEIDDHVYYLDREKGMVSVDDSTKVFPNSNLLKDHLVRDVFVSEEQNLFITQNDGIFSIIDDRVVPANKETHRFLKENGAYCTHRLSKNTMAIGTQFGGMITIDQHGKTLRKLDRKDGLTNNNVHTIAQSPQGHLWLGTSNGINKVALNSPLEILPSNSQMEGTFYDIQEFNNQLYLGSNNALYSTPLHTTTDNYSEISYSTLKGSEGPVWGLDVIDNDLFMGHNNGAFQVVDNEVIPLSTKSGAWKFVEARNKKEMYVGTYEGIDIYKKIQGRWTFFKKLEGFIESSRIMISVNKNEVWVSHPYRGVYKIEHNDDYFVEQVTLYDQRYGLPSILANYIFEINNIPYVTAEKGIYYYDRVEDRFVSDESMNTLIDSTKNVRRLFQENENKIWFLAENEAGYLEKSQDKSWQKVLYPSIVDKFVNGFEEMYFFNKSVAMICGIDNVLRLSLAEEIIDQNPKAIITDVHLLNSPDSLLFGGMNSSEAVFSNQQNIDQIPELKHFQNEIVFSYAYPDHQDGISYSYALSRGEENMPNELDWSNWTSQTIKEYNNLSDGDYTFAVRAQSQNGDIGDISTFSFVISPPWYYSNLAFTIYWIVFAGMLAALIFIPQKKFKKEKKILTSAKEASDAEVELLKTEKLEAEIAFQNSELASSTMHLVQKNETINKIRHEIVNVSKKIKDAESKRAFRKILSLFSDDERLENEWENFSRHFDKVHTDFLKRISADYPQLTPKDKKLCAYLRMNLSTKEIAPLLNISVRGVEISRYRLRKKLDLKNETNLNEFMMGF